MVPAILPPPLTILHVPPLGAPTNVLVVLSQISAALVKLLAGSLFVTVNDTSLVVAGHPPLAAIVYLTVTNVSLFTELAV